MELQLKPHPISVPFFSSVDELEACLREIFSLVARQVIEIAVRQAEARWLAHEGRGYLSKGWQTRVLTTTLGEIPIARRKFYCPRSRKTVIPFDRAISFKRETTQVKEASVRLASEVSYAKASRFLGLTLGITRSSKRVWRDLQEAGRQIDERAAALSEHMHATGEVVGAKDITYPLVAVEADGTFVKGRKRGESHEVKLVIAYTEKYKLGKSRWLLGNKQSWGGVFTSAELSKRLNFVLEQQYGLSTAGQLIGRSDGAAWISSLFDSLSVRLTHQLDLHHLVRRLSESVGDADAQAACLKYAYKGDGRALLARLRRRASQLQDRKAMLATLEAAGYVRNHLDRIDSLAAFRQSAEGDELKKMYCRGSGAIERNISARICDRMKHRRMHWTPSGAHHMAQIRTVLANEPEARLFN
jgi:hypothetical protein